MEPIDRTAYWAKLKLPWLYNGAAEVSRVATILLYGDRIARVQTRARIEGTVANHPALMRPLTPSDLGSLDHMIAIMPSKHLTYFHPHRFDSKALADIIARRDVMTYGLFVNDELVAYAVLKLFATKKAYIGRLVSPAMAGLGIGKYLSLYLYWQAHELGFNPYSTISIHNIASLRSHALVRPFAIVAPLPNDFQLIRFNLLPSDAHPPPLKIEAHKE